MATIAHPPGKLLLTKEEVAEALAVSGRTVQRLVALGELRPPLRIGRARTRAKRSPRWRREWIEQYLNRLEREARRG